MSGRDVRQLLRAVPQVHAQLADALLPGSGNPQGERVSGGGGNDVPAPARLEVADHRHQLLRGLRWWLTVTELPPLAPTPRGVGGHPAKACAVLMSRLPRLPRGHHAELADNLETWLRRARQLTAPEPVRRVPLPVACLASTELWTCPGELALAIPTKGTTQPWLGCRECQGRWPVTELPQAANVTVPVHVAAELLGVSVSTIKRRAAREGGTVKLGDAMASAAADCAL